LASATLTGPARAALPALLVRATSAAVLRVLAGQTPADVLSANVLVLIRGGAQTMFLAKLKTAAVALLIVGAAFAGIVALSRHAPLIAQAPAAAAPEAATVQRSAATKERASPP